MLLILVLFLEVLLWVAVVLEDEVAVHNLMRLQILLEVTTLKLHLVTLLVVALLVLIGHWRWIGELIVAAAVHHLVLLRLSVVVIVANGSGLIERLIAI